MRIQGWDIYFSKYLADNKNRSGVFGEFDCALFVCDIYYIFHGVDLAERFRRKYKTAAEAKELAITFLDLPKDTSTSDMVYRLWCYMAKENNILEVEPAFAQRGDVVCYLALQTTEHALGVIDMNGKDIVTPGILKLERLPLEEATIFGVWAI